MKTVLGLLKELGWSKQAIRDFDFLARKDEDLEVFVNEFFNFDDKPTLIIDRFREYLLEKYQMTSAEFLLAARKNRKEALEQLFQQVITQVELKLLDRRQKEWGLTLEDLYYLHMRDRKKRLWSWLSTTYTKELLNKRRIQTV